MENIEVLKNNFYEAIKNNELSFVKRFFNIYSDLLKDNKDFKEEILKNINEYGNSEILEYIVEKDLSIKEDCYDDSFKISAIYNNNISIIEYFVKNCLNDLTFDRNDTSYEYYPNILHFACEKRKIEIVKLFANCKTDLNSIDWNGRTSFFKAFIWDKLEIADLLFNLGADIFIETENGDLPFFHFATQNKIEYLLERGYDINQKNGYDQNIAFFIKGDILLWAIQSKLNIFQKDKSENNVLHWACYCGDIEKVKQLLKLNFDPNEKNSSGWTPLHLACRNGNVQIIIALLRAGVDINSKNNWGQTPLHQACIENYYSAVEILLAFDASTSIEDSYKKLPLEYTENEDIQNLLGVSSCEPKLYHYDEIQLAVANNNLKKIESLKDENYDFGSLTYRSDHPLFMCINNNNFSIFKLLINSYDFKNLYDNDGRNLLLKAVISNRNEIIDFLIQRNIDTNECDNNQFNAIHYAVLNNNYEIVKKFVLIGVDAQLEENSGVTPLDLAYKNGYLELIKFFSFDIYNIYTNNNIAYIKEIDDDDDWDENEDYNDFHCYNNPADDPSENPWIDVFGEGEEAHDAYWNTE